ncbi:MAG: ATP-binding protein [Candidatus Micrarchaeia archaeon]
MDCASACLSPQEFESTAEVSIPRDPLQQVIGQEEAVRLARIACKQRRNLLLVGPPGTGKSLIAQAIAFHLPKPSQEVSVLHNPEAPERPIVEVRTAADIAKEKKLLREIQGRLVSPSEVPSFVAERLGFRCRKCGRLSKPDEQACPNCGNEKYSVGGSPFGDLLAPYLEEGKRVQRVHTTRSVGDKEEVIVYEAAGEKIHVLDQPALEKIDALKKARPRKVLVPLERKTFVAATGSSETELLGDVRHDPYGGHAQVGTLPYARVLPGAVHEAHEGVLFIDELGALNAVQRFLLTAMQEKKYPIVGKNPQSAGASVRVDDVPCDFILVAASNINDLHLILPPLRSRLIGNGYEVLLDTFLPDTPENRAKFVQFVAQEIRKDAKIPHALPEAVQAIISEARRRAFVVDGAANSLTLRLRELSGVIRLAGDLAVAEKAQFIEERHVARAIEKAKAIEQQLAEKYGSVWKASASEASFNARTTNASAGKEIS